jgi:SGT1 protein
LSREVKMDFKVRDDDFVEYNIYPATESVSDQDLSELRDRCLQILAPYVIDYLWHIDSFNLQTVPGNQKVRTHLRGRIHFGDSVEDEWFAVSLVVRLTSAIDVVATLRDADGEVLLIEAADNLPLWAQGT